MSKTRSQTVSSTLSVRSTATGLVAQVDELIKGRYSARYYLPDKVDRAIIEDVVGAANNAPSGNNMQPWKVYCIAGVVKDTISAEMVEAHKINAPHQARYNYYPPTLPPDYATRRFNFGKLFYGSLGIDHDDLEGRAEQMTRNFEFFDAPVALIFTINGQLLQGSWMDLGHFMQSITLGLRARGLESVTQLSVPKYDAVLRKHLPIPDTDLVACSISLGYPDLEKITKHYVRPNKVPLKDILEIHGM
ncbi:P-Nitrobenzoate reductase [Mycena galericulata]|nr:P-Nitrobenzoate reductase [Mycena galericulata]